MHLSLQDGWTALLKSSVAGHMECVQVILDKGADVNKQSWVSGVIIHCLHAMQHVHSVPSSEGRHVHKNPIVLIMFCAWRDNYCCTAGLND